MEVYSITEFTIYQSAYNNKARLIKNGYFLPVGEWSFVTATLSDSNLAKLYINVTWLTNF